MVEAQKSLFPIHENLKPRIEGRGVPQIFSRFKKSKIKIKIKV